MKLTRTLGNQLPGVLPTPDPDLNRALLAVLDDGIELNSTIQAFADPPTTEQANHHPYAGNNVLLCLGIHGQMIYVNRAGHLVAAKLSSWPLPQDATKLFSTIAAFDEIATTFS